MLLATVSVQVRQPEVEHLLPVVPNEVRIGFPQLQVRQALGPLGGRHVRADGEIPQHVIRFVAFSALGIAHHPVNQKLGGIGVLGRVDHAHHHVRADPHHRGHVHHHVEVEIGVLFLVPQTGVSRKSHGGIVLAGKADRLGHIVGGALDDGIVVEQPQNPLVAGILDTRAQFDRLAEHLLVFGGHVIAVLDDGRQNLDKFGQLLGIGENDASFPLGFGQIPQRGYGGRTHFGRVVDQRVHAGVMHEKRFFVFRRDHRLQIRRHVIEDQLSVVEFIDDGGRIFQEDDIRHVILGRLLRQDLGDDLGGVHVETVHFDAGILFFERFAEFENAR